MRDYTETGGYIAVTKMSYLPVGRKSIKYR